MIDGEDQLRIPSPHGPHQSTALRDSRQYPHPHRAAGGVYEPRVNHGQRVTTELYAFQHLLDRHLFGNLLNPQPMPDQE